MSDPPLDKKTRNELQAMTTLANSLSVLDQKQRDRVIRWVCELFELSNPSEEFDEELEFDKKRQVTPSSIKDARRLLRDALVECPGYKASWRNDVSSLIAQDLAALMNPISLSMEVRDSMSEKIIHHLFSVED